MEMSNTLEGQRQARLLSTILLLTGFLFIGAGLAIGILVHPLGFVALAVGIVDLLIARRLVPERAGTVLSPDASPHADPDLAVADAEPDATANPYARED
jgi:hypothetical protein